MTCYPFHSLIYNAWMEKEIRNSQLIHRSIHRSISQSINQNILQCVKIFSFRSKLGTLELYISKEVTFSVTSEYYYSFAKKASFLPSQFFVNRLASCSCGDNVNATVWGRDWPSTTTVYSTCILFPNAGTKQEAMEIVPMLIPFHFEYLPEGVR